MYADIIIINIWKYLFLQFRTKHPNDLLSVSIMCVCCWHKHPSSFASVLFYHNIPDVKRLKILHNFVFSNKNNKIIAYLLYNCYND